jgi:nucleotide-binding universal stress UspA family protein
VAVLSARPKIAVKNIVVTTDFSAASEVALGHALAIARSYGSKIHLVHALGTGEPAAGHGKETEAEAEHKLEVEAAMCGEVPCSRWVLKGSAIGVVEPILAVGPNAKPCEEYWEPKRVLLATDLQSDESSATRCAVFLAREHGARLAFLHVAPPAAAPFPEDQQTIARPYFESRLRELLSYKPGLDYPAEFWVEFSADPVREILDVACHRDMDLVVISVHRDDPWGFHFVHDAYRIVAEAPCPILITQRKF